MSASAPSTGRAGSFLRFLFALLFFFVARGIAAHSSTELADGAWAPLVEQMLLALLLLLAYASLGFWLDRQVQPVDEQGLTRRQGWGQEAALGMSVGWGIALIPVLAMAFFGGIATSFTWHLVNVGWFFADLAFFAFAALAEEIAFRGYAFQRLAASIGPLAASFLFAALNVILISYLPGASRSSIAVGAVLTLLLSAAYVRTRALWVSWGINFAWKASRALLFGLAVAGVNDRSPIVQGNPMGNFWLTGGAFGLDASWFAFFVILAAIPVLFQLTKNLNERYNSPEVVPGGIPVDIEALARAQHQAAQAQPAAPPLVQIAPVPQAPSSGLPPVEKPRE